MATGSNFFTHPMRTTRRVSVKKRTRTSVALLKKVGFFRGHRCNQGWMALESREASALRGHGWQEFTSLLIRERGGHCQKCPSSFVLRVVNVLSPVTHRHLRFERNNCLVLCPDCRLKFRKVKQVMAIMARGMK